MHYALIIFFLLILLILAWFNIWNPGQTNQMVQSSNRIIQLDLKQSKLIEAKQNKPSTLPLTGEWSPSSSTFTLLYQTQPIWTNSTFQHQPNIIQSSFDPESPHIVLTDPEHNQQHHEGRVIYLQLYKTHGNKWGVNEYEIPPPAQTEDHACGWGSIVHILNVKPCSLWITGHGYTKSIFVYQIPSLHYPPQIHSVQKIQIIENQMAQPFFGLYLALDSQQQDTVWLAGPQHIWLLQQNSSSPWQVTNTWSWPISFLDSSPTLKNTIITNLSIGDSQHKCIQIHFKNKQTNEIQCLEIFQKI